MTREETTQQQQQQPADNTALVVDDLKQNCAYLERAGSTFDSRFTLKVLRGLPALRKRVDPESLTKIIQLEYPLTDPSRQVLLGYVQSVKGDEDVEIADDAPTSIAPEVDVFLHLLVQVWLLNTDKDATRFKELSAQSVAKLRQYNRRSLDYLAAKIWFYYSWAHELTDDLESIVPLLLGALRTATLRHDNETQASLITLLLRNYLAAHKISQAANLVAKTTFPESASNALAARYLYYLGRISAIQLNYSAAYDQITAAIRKAPQTSRVSGFMQAAHKLSIVIELLIGDIPDRAVFKDALLERPLRPYFEVAKAVRAGDIAQFGETLAKHAAALKRDGTYTLVSRLRQNVIKTGIRIMSITYSRISLKDICARLHLDSEESAEYIVAKAIRDGVIDAEIDHEQGFMQSKEVLDIYSTSEPQNTFHDRIKFCISLHDDSVKSMRYSINDHRVDFKSVEEAREREKELVSEIQEGTDDEDDGDFDI